MSDELLQKHQISSYRRGTIMGLTAAEAFMLISFILLLVLMLWKVVADEKLERADRISTLDTDIIMDRLRLMDNDNLRRLAEAAQRLPADTLQKLTDLVSNQDVAQQMQQYEDLLALGKTPEELRRAVAQAELLAEMSRELEAYRQANLTPEEVLEIKAAITSVDHLSEMSRELAAYRQANLTPEEVMALKAVVKDVEHLTDLSHELEAYRKASLTPEEVLAMKAAMQHIADARRRLDSTGTDVARKLREKAGERIAALGGRILEDGDVIFPDKVLFERGSSRITPAFDHLLVGFCRPWFEVLYNEDRFLETVQIEGHASSEYGNLPGRNAFDSNLDLSQQRAAAVFKRCLDYGGNDEVAAWARSKLAAVGYSSARLVLSKGQEDREASRRVVFSIDMRSEDEVVSGVFSERSQDAKAMDHTASPQI